MAVGEYTGREDITAFCGNYKDEIKYVSGNQGYTTAQFTNMNTYVNTSRNAE